MLHGGEVPEVTPELLMGETGLERLAKISRDKNAFKRTRDVVRTPHLRPP